MAAEQLGEMLEKYSYHLIQLSGLMETIPGLQKSLTLLEENQQLQTYLLPLAMLIRLFLGVHLLLVQLFQGNLR
jgi:hypothetical protein